MAAKSYLIANADDFGLSKGVNQGIIKTYEQGIVTSAREYQIPGDLSFAKIFISGK